MSSNRQDFVLESTDTAPLHGIVQLPQQSGPRPTVVICHGFKGFMEWGFFPPLADLLCARGFTVVRFNYSGSGMKHDDDLVTDLDAFRRNTFSQERDETLQILDALGTEIAPGRVDPRVIGLLGHSRGGCAALLAAADPRWRDRLQALVTWAAISKVDRFGPRAEAAWERDGVVEIENGRTGQTLPLGIELLHDIRENHRALDLHEAAGERRAPWLIVHGEGDETVPVAEARYLDDAAAEPSELLVIPRAGHTFGAVHPFAGPTPYLTQTLNATQTWFRRHLG